MPPSKSSPGSRDRNKKSILLSVALGVILLISAVSYASFSINSATSRTDERDKFGGLNSAHEHAGFEVKINGSAIDFSQERYQLKSPFIHVESGNGFTLHKHSTLVPVGEFFRSIGFNVTPDNCFLMDDGSKYCDSGSDKLRFFVNGEERAPFTIMTYILSDEDRFLLVYGQESNDDIRQQLTQLENLELVK